VQLGRKSRARTRKTGRSFTSSGRKSVQQLSRATRKWSGKQVTRPRPLAAHKKAAGCWQSKEEGLSHVGEMLAAVAQRAGAIYQVSKAKLKLLSTWLWTTTTAGRVLFPTEKVKCFVGNCRGVSRRSRRTCSCAGPAVPAGGNTRGGGKSGGAACVNFFSDQRRDFPLRRVKTKAAPIEKWVTSNRKMYFIVCIRTFRFSDLCPLAVRAIPPQLRQTTSDLVFWH